MDHKKILRIFCAEKTIKVFSCILKTPNKPHTLVCGKTQSFFDLMTLADIQKEVDDWTKQFKPQYWPPLQIMARLTEENGEVAREINHLYGIKKRVMKRKIT